MTELESVVLRSERLRLVPTCRDYAEAIFETFTPAVTTFMYPASPTAIQETLDFLQRAEAANQAGIDLQVAVFHNETGEFLGHAGLHGIRTRSPELGIWIKETAHGHHYGREAVTSLARWALETLDFDYLKYPVDRRNIPSRRIPESLGGSVEAEYQVTNEAGNLLDLVEYRIYRETLASLLEGVFSHTENYETQIQKMPENSPKFENP
ncbi:MAG: GNAT family N-acetyltransferase [Dehalococcoidia bacterium]